MIELRESDTARAMLRQTQVFQRMKLEDPERYKRLEHLCSRMYFDAKEVYQVGMRLRCAACGCAALHLALLHCVPHTLALVYKHFAIKSVAHSHLPGEGVSF